MNCMMSLTRIITTFRSHPIRLSSAISCQVRSIPLRPIYCPFRANISSNFQRPYSCLISEASRKKVPLVSSYCPTRSYAKKTKKEKKDKGGKGKGAKPKISLTDGELNEVINFSKFNQQLDTVVEKLKEEYVTQLTVHTRVGALDQLAVETPDGKFPLIQLGQIAQKNPQLIVINLATCPQYVKQVKIAIMESGMNLNPQQDGTTLFVPIPKVTKEHRENLAKNAKNLFMKTKEKIRDIHNTFVRDLKKQKGKHSDDTIHSVQEHIDANIKECVERAEQLMQIKQKELLQESR